jgi:hypothetical protein
MKIDIAHLKNPAIGWDISVRVAADQGKKLSFAKVAVNGSPVFSGDLGGLSSWSRTFTQQGEYPGHNTVRVDITNDKGEETSDEDTWDKNGRT